MTCLYLIAVLPPDDLSLQINEIRVQCSKKFGVQKALNPPVHITLRPTFEMESRYEAQICRHLKSCASGFNPFRQDVENFEAFATNAVVILAKKNAEIMGLQKGITNVFRKNGSKTRLEGNKSSSFRPHLTIAYRDIPPEVFPKIWDEYKDARFKRTFTLDQFSLLKHDGKKWNRLNDFKLCKTGWQTELF